MRVLKMFVINFSLKYVKEEEKILIDVQKHYFAQLSGSKSVLLIWNGSESQLEGFVCPKFVELIVH